MHHTHTHKYIDWLMTELYFECLSTFYANTSYFYLSRIVDTCRTFSRAGPLAVLRDPLISQHINNTTTLINIERSS